MKFPKNMNRALLLNAAMITAVGGTSAAETSNQAATSRQKAISSRPNVIFFLVDDLGWSDIASFGSRFYETAGQYRKSERIGFVDEERA